MTINDKINFIEDYKRAENASTGSKYDSNANVSCKNIATLQCELGKKDIIDLNRRITSDYLKKLYPNEDIANMYFDDLNNHIKENNKGICDSLNENVSVPEQKIKPSMIKKMAKARLKEEYLAKAKDELNETEEALVVVYGEGV